MTVSRAFWVKMVMTAMLEQLLMLAVILVAIVSAVAAALMDHFTTRG